jgi:hypothetical protein
LVSLKDGSVLSSFFGKAGATATADRVLLPAALVVMAAGQQSLGVVGLELWHSLPQSRKEIY